MSFRILPSGEIEFPFTVDELLSGGELDGVSVSPATCRVFINAMVKALIKSKFATADTTDHCTETIYWKWESPPEGAPGKATEVGSEVQ
ncbi:MAG: hypothetical protein AAGI44_09675 [Pseudomonadota bacterium]